jgi:hypothetical protein
MMDDQKILDNAPEIKNNAGALLYYSPESDRYYEEHDGYWYEVDDYTMTKITAPTAFIRSLADIKELVELRKANVELKKESQALRSVLPKYITEDENNPLLKELLYCCDGLYCDYAQENYGDAKNWLRHINDAYGKYQDNLDDKEDEALKAGN